MQMVLKTVFPIIHKHNYNNNPGRISKIAEINK